MAGVFRFMIALAVVAATASGARAADPVQTLGVVEIEQEAAAQPEFAIAPGPAAAAEIRISTEKHSLARAAISAGELLVMPEARITAHPDTGLIEVFSGAAALTADEPPRTLELEYAVITDFTGTIRLQALDPGLELVVLSGGLELRVGGRTLALGRGQRAVITPDREIAVHDELGRSRLRKLRRKIDVYSEALKGGQGPSHRIDDELPVLDEGCFEYVCPL